MTEQIDIPRAWDQLRVERLCGTLLVIGAPDVGKTTFAQYVYRRLCAGLGGVAYLDGDPGQSILGPPTTITVAVAIHGEDSFPPRGQMWRRFVGAVSPRGHMLPLLVGASQLVRAAWDAGAETIVYDTTGLVDPVRGGLALKLAMVDLLRPTTVFAIQRSQELESLLIPLRRSRRVRVIDLNPAPVSRRRDVPTRQAHRARQFAAYFAAAGDVGARHLLTADWGRLAVFPTSRFFLDRLVALEDASGFVLGLGIVLQSDIRARQVTLYTPLASLVGVNALRLGDVVVDPRTFRDQRLTAMRERLSAASTQCAET